MEMCRRSIDSFGETATVAVIGVSGNCCGSGLACEDVLKASEATVAAVIKEFLLASGFVDFPGEIAVGVVCVCVG